MASIPRSHNKRLSKAQRRQLKTRQARQATTRGWCKNTVLRAEPCLFGLYTLVALLYASLPARAARVRVVDWPGKRDVTFSDAMTAVRRWLWQEWVFAIPGHSEAFQKLPVSFRSLRLSGLVPAS